MGFEDLLNPSRLLTFFFMFIRISGIMFTAPIFSSNALTNMIRITLSILVSLILIPTVPLIDITELNTLWLILVAFKELLIGVVIGAMTSLLFSAIQLGGYLIDYQMGFSMVSVIDPTSDAAISFSSQVYNILATLIYLAIYGHHIFLRAVASSFEFLPLVNFPFEENALMYVISTFIRVFIVAVQITAPVFIALMIVNAVMGVMARLVPQINLMVVGFPLKIAIGAIVLILSLRLFYIVFEKIMYEYFRAISTFFEKMGGG